MSQVTPETGEHGCYLITITFAMQSNLSQAPDPSAARMADSVSREPTAMRIYAGTAKDGGSRGHGDDSGRFDVGKGRPIAAVSDPRCAVSVTFAPLLLYWCGRGDVGPTWLVAPLCFAVIFLVPAFNFHFSGLVIGELRRPRVTT
jgi:hypothetical protein